jgi:hypothetical protein
VFGLKLKRMFVLFMKINITLWEWECFRKLKHR